MKHRPTFETYFLIIALLCCSISQAQLLNSWEGGLENWAPGSGFSITNTSGSANAGIGVTQGIDSLQVVLPTQGFQRWGSVTLDAQQLADITAAAANPLTNRIEFDVTYDTNSIPQGSVTFVNNQIAIQTDQGWSQVDFSTVTNGQTNETVTYRAPLTRFATVTPNNTSVQILMAANGDWGADVPATIFYDNLTLSEIIPDLDTDGDVDPADWGIFIGAHNTDISGLTSSQQFLMGDLDSDADNDFDDFLIFESAYDQANGPGAFQALVPEPTACVMLLMGVVVASFCRRRRAALLVLMAMGLSVSVPERATAQLTNVLLNGWETDVEGWGPTTFGAIPSSVAVATTGVTEGVQSLGITQDEDTFSWAAFHNYGAGSAGYDAFAAAVDVGADNYAVEFDITFDTSSIPQDLVTTVSTSIALNSGGGWIQYNSVAASTGFLDETTHVSIPLDQVVNPPSGTTGSGQLAPASATGFYQIVVGLDGDWGLDPATFYFDDLRLVQLTEPDVLTLQVDRASGGITLQNPGNGSFDANYYTITSSAGSLDSAGWNSLDDQNYDAVDGPDAGSVAGDSVFEGWDEAGGSNAFNLTEANLMQPSTFGPMASISLGDGYTAGSTEDLVFKYRDLSRPNLLTAGEVIYVGVAPEAMCDLNGDTVCNNADIDALYDEISAGTNGAAFDFNGDSLVNNDDISGWLTEAGTENGKTYLAGDTDLDGGVGGSDFTSLASNFGNSNADPSLGPAYWGSGNFDGNGNTGLFEVGGSDFTSLASNFGFTSLAAVPEPTTLPSLLIGACLLLVRRRK